MSVEVTVGQASLKSLELQLPTSGLVNPLIFIRICKASVAPGSWVFWGVLCSSVYKVRVAMASEHHWKGRVLLQAHKQHPAQLSSKKCCHARPVLQHACTGLEASCINLNLFTLGAVILNFQRLPKKQEAQCPVSSLLGKCCRKTKPNKKKWLLPGPKAALKNENDDSHSLC